jgi:hypothetical protein
MAGPSTPISETAALHLLTARGAYTPHKAAMRLDKAIGENDCRLWGDGKLVDPVRFQTGELAVTAVIETDGRCRAEIVSTRDNPSHPPLYRKRRPPPYDVCELDQHEVMALLPPEAEPADAPPPAAASPEATAPAQPAPAQKKVSEAALQACLLSIVKEHPAGTPPPEEAALHEELERRLKAPLARDRVRDARDRVAPNFKLPRGRQPIT